MLEQILKKLGCKTVEEIFEREELKQDQFAGTDADWNNPFLQLTDEEIDYFEHYILPSLSQPKSKASIKSQLLKICVECFKEILHSNGNPHFGAPPTVFYIDFGVGSKREIEEYNMVPEETYRYESGIMEKVQTGTRNLTRPLSGIYFPEGHGSIGILKDNSYAYVSYLVGPRFGRGFRYKILSDEEGLRLVDKELVWIS